MLDTLKVSIPLAKAQHKRIRDVAAKADRWQWVLCNESTGELMFRRISGLASMDGESFHRELRWDIPQTYGNDCKLSLEFSVPKYWYGHNIRLLYDFIAALKSLKRSLEKQFGMKGRGQLPDVMNWEVSRVDACYGWQFPHQRLAQQFLDSLKRLHFPRKSPVIYPTAILFKGNTYSVKFYLKHPEFRSHDLKALVKANASLEWVNHCEQMADGVLRFEVTLRSRYLKRQGITTVNDLVKPSFFYEWNDGYEPTDELENMASMWAVVCFYLNQEGVDVTDIQKLMETPKDKGHPIYDGQTISAPSLRVELPDRCISFPGGSLTYRQKHPVTSLLQGFLTKFVGENAGMQKADEVESKLLESFKPVKAARLVSFWLYIQKFGSSKARDVFGKRSYYYSRTELKKAGVTLIEPPSGKVISIVDRDFLQNFRLEIPSQYAVNKVDDFRNSENILNFVPKMSELG
jgi:hypothetical protein